MLFVVVKVIMKQKSDGLRGLKVMRMKSWLTHQVRELGVLWCTLSRVGVPAYHCCGTSASTEEGSMLRAAQSKQSEGENKTLLTPTVLQSHPMGNW